MHKHEEKYCPKCNQIFVCKVGDVSNCQCNNVKLSAATLSFLEKTNFDCLCAGCMQQINEQVAQMQRYIFPTQKDMFTPELHYYIENGNWVFTEMYHMLRGYCCESGCRHCVYGYNKSN